MDVLKLVRQVAPYAVPLLSLALQGYGTFKKSKVSSSPRSLGTILLNTTEKALDNTNLIGYIGV
jgi:hypothetical protein